MRATQLIATTGLVAIALGGCVVQENDVHPVARVIPTANDVQIRVPDQAATASERTIGQLADYYVLTRTISRDLNAGAAWVLLTVHFVVQFPPTSSDGDTYTWGPYADALAPAEWRLTVTELADGSYDWNLDGRSRTVADASFENLIWGNAVPGAQDHRGTGDFTIDFDAAERVDPIDNDARGQVAVTYDLENRDGTSATLAMSIDSYETDAQGNDVPVHFDYGYAEVDDGAGELLFAIHGDLDDEGALAEEAEIRSSWLATGAGRADVTARGGDLGELEVSATECWDTSFARVYYADSQQWMPTEGDPSACAATE
jgi:hypothetical protein